MAKHLVQLVVKNTSELDFSAPLLWHLRREEPETRITVLYMGLSKSSFLNHGKFYSDLFRTSGIDEKDLADFLRPGFGFLAPLIRFYFSRNRAEWTSVRAALSRVRTSFRTGREVLTACRGFIRAAAGYAHFWLEKKATSLIDVGRILPRLAPDAVLVGHRRLKIFQEFYDYYEQTRVPVILLPHAPHQIHPVEDFQSFDFNRPTIEVVENGQTTVKPYFPDFVDYWCSFFFDELWRNVPGHRAQFPYVGYSAFSHEWRELMQSKRGPLKRLGQPATKLTCVLIMRRFLEPGQARAPGLDHFIMDYQPMYDYLVRVREALAASGGDVHVLVKPHPSNNLEQLREIMRASGQAEWSVSEEPFFDVIPRADFCISMFSTSILLPLMAGVPCLTVHTPLQDYVHSRWDKVRELYEGLSGYVGPGDSLLAKVQAIRRRVAQAEKSGIGVQSDVDSQNDIAHIQKFFPGDPLKMGRERIAQLLKNVTS